MCSYVRLHKSSDNTVTTGRLGDCGRLPWGREIDKLVSFGSVEIRRGILQPPTSRPHIQISSNVVHRTFEIIPELGLVQPARRPARASLLVYAVQPMNQPGQPNEVER